MDKPSPIFLDTNILLDIFLERPYMLDSSSRIFDMIENSDLEGYISSISLVNIHYISRKYRSKEEVHTYIQYLFDTFSVINADEEAMVHEFNKGAYTDFEDMIQAVSATSVGAICITRDKTGFLPFLGLQVYTPDEYIEKMKEKGYNLRG